MIRNISFAALWPTKDQPLPGPPHQESIRSVELCDCTFVDDEAVVLLAKSPKTLDKSIDCLLSTLVGVFSNFCLKINWAPGKSEGMLSYKGHGATAAFESRRVDGKVCIALPATCDSKYLTVVSRYKHLGTVSSLDSSPVYDAHIRASGAMQTYGPLSNKIFGSPKILLWLKLHFMKTLLLSRLLFQVQVWVPSIKSTRILNGPYMRCLRKIAGQSRFDPKCEMSDLQVRMHLVQPSID